MGLFAISLDLILGYAGIISLGHAAFFGLGGYTAGILAQHGFGEPLSGLVLGGLAAGVLGFATSFLVLRGSDLTRLMVTLGICLMLYGSSPTRCAGSPAAPTAFKGVAVWPILGDLDASISTAAPPMCYSMIVLFLVLSARPPHHPFAVTALPCAASGRTSGACTPSARRWRGVSWSPTRSAAAFAGIAGALLTETTQFVSLDVLSFDKSAEVLLMVVLGGAGTLYGGIVGRLGPHRRPVPALGHQPPILAVLGRASRSSPWSSSPGAASWGLPRDGICPAPEQRAPRSSARRRLSMAAALETTGLMKHFGALAVANNISLTVEQGARHALIGPNGAGKTTLVNLLTGVLVPNGGRVILDGVDITGEPQHRRVALGLARTFQVNQLFPNMTPLESVALAVAQRRGTTARWWPRLAKNARDHRRGGRALGSPASPRLRPRADARRCPTDDSACSRSPSPSRLQPRVLLLDEPAAGVPEGEGVELYDALAELPSHRRRAADRARHGFGVPLRPPHHRAGRRFDSGRRAARGDIRRSPRARSLFGRGRAWVSFCASRICPPVTATRSCCPACR